MRYRLIKFGCCLCQLRTKNIEAFGTRVVFIAAEDELYSFEGACLSFPAERDVTNKDDTSNSGSDLETGESDGSQSAKELYQICCDRGQDALPCHKVKVMAYFKI